ncbi:hypothetical protein AURDEDRAFT_177614 [Auricularia subglabra TFB-10046 SS5]|uniref:Uncharacterized protein n=1 Tax=Auricularia subglabra (strain TFB-10046 / SS5) TaxID=717982 RepID=J0D3P7_AURST|nr:hypothetical protein AURDEDRAFT_177614 [Auricularia subglabra TFB-10046 SS5]
MVVIPTPAIRMWTPFDGRALLARRPSPPSPQQRRPHRTLFVLYRSPIPAAPSLEQLSNRSDLDLTALCGTLRAARGNDHS